jgi:hypothetical protein
MDEPLTSKEKVDQEGLRLFAEWLGMNYGKKVFGDHMEHHALRIFSHATSVIRSRASAHEPLSLPAEVPAAHRPGTEPLLRIVRDIEHCLNAINPEHEVYGILARVRNQLATSTPPPGADGVLKELSYMLENGKECESLWTARGVIIDALMLIERHRLTKCADDR